MDERLAGLFRLARRHGDREGAEAEIADLQDLCAALWGLLTHQQRREFLGSEEVAALREVAGD